MPKQYKDINLAVLSQVTEEYSTTREIYQRVKDISLHSVHLSLMHHFKLKRVEMVKASDEAEIADYRWRKMPIKTAAFVFN